MRTLFEVAQERRKSFGWRTVKQQNAVERRGTVRAGRWFVRALLVVGGAVAGTAAAWAIGTASASAETANPALPPESTTQQDVAGAEITPVTDAAMSATDDVLLGASNLTGDAAAAAVRVGTHPAPDTNRDQQVAGDVRDAVHHFTQDAVLHPAQRVLGSAEQISRKPQNAPKVIGNALTPPQGFLDFLHPTSGTGLIKLPALAGSHESGQHAPIAAPVSENAAAPAPAAPTDPFATVLPGKHAEAFHADSRGDRDSHHHGVRSGQFPFSPTRGPLAPSGFPVAPGGSAAGGHVDGPLLGVPANALTVVDADGLRAVRFDIRHTPVEPGTQPGVAPD
jgi:hypothetical protein